MGTNFKILSCNSLIPSMSYFRSILLLNNLKTSIEKEEIRLCYFKINFQNLISFGFQKWLVYTFLKTFSKIQGSQQMLYLLHIVCGFNNLFGILKSKHRLHMSAVKIIIMHINGKMLV